ncbi:MAG TPA: hypothetical protein EYQ24_02885, partial [Bacteroidetes bacterium]|nr:hypothetical protein [Bacteroidota bacterium]
MTVTSPSPAPDAQSWSYDLLPLLDARVVFVHIPKTGGLSIANAVYRTEGGGHRTVEEYKRELGPEVFASLVSFTVVREPTERLASAFRFLKRGGINDLDQAFAAEHLAPFDTLEDFVTGWLTPETARSQIHFRQGTPPETPGVDGGVYLQVRDVDRFYAEIRERGAFGEGFPRAFAAIREHPPEDKDYRLRDTIFVDLNGYVV